jgi:hypothetical protein
MTTITLTNTKRHSYLLIYFAISVLLTTFLCYIDEGNYNLDGLKNESGLVFFLSGIVGMFLGQTIAHYFFFKTHYGFLKIFLTSLVGIPLGVGGAFAIGCLYGILFHFGH